MSLLVSLIPERLGRLSLFCFCQEIVLSYSVHQYLFSSLSLPYQIGGYLVLGVGGVLTSKYLFSETQDDFPVCWRASLLGGLFSLGLHVSLVRGCEIFGHYVLFMSFFHFSEYLATAVTNPSNLSTDSFLLNHSPAYHIAAVVSWAEFALESYYLPWLKTFRCLSQCGAAVCLGGELLRKLAMVHAGRSFNHLVQSDKRDDHVLVTSGVFSLCRHPSYVGWFYWSIGTQLVLLNPVCSLAYAYVSWQFFEERIYIEEYALLQFFGEHYVEYKKKVPSGLPFISGYDKLKM